MKGRLATLNKHRNQSKETRTVIKRNGNKNSHKIECQVTMARLSGFNHSFKKTKDRKTDVKVNSRNKSTQVRLDEEGKDIRIKQINTGTKVNRDKRAQVGLIEEGKDMKIEQTETGVKRSSQDKRAWGDLDKERKATSLSNKATGENSIIFNYKSHCDAFSDLYDSELNLNSADQKSSTQENTLLFGDLWQP
ncbi:unnamed protein product, partial [Hymenolepis diminuta]